MSPEDVLLSTALGGAAALAATLAASALPRLRLATRRALVVAGLVVALLAPVVALAGSWLGLGIRPPHVSATNATHASRATAAERRVPARESALAGTFETAPSASRPAARSEPRPAEAPAPRPLPWPVLATIAWLGGAAIGLIRLGLGLLRVRSLRRTLRLPRDPRLAGLHVSDALTVPATVGLLSPVVVVPTRLARDLSEGDLAAIRRHEASHVTRRDPLAGLVARIVRALHWPNPLAHVAARRLDSLCEALADAEAVGPRSAEARRYASCLVRIAERATEIRVAAGVHGIVARGRALTRRVEALLDPSGPLDPRPTWRGRGAAAGVTVLSVALAACCCRAPAPARAPGAVAPRAPSVAGFSPRGAPTDPDTGEMRPAYTDGRLLVNTDPSYPGRICVFFRRGSRIDPTSVFLGGDPRLGLDLSAVQILRYIPGTGSVPVLPADHGIQVLEDKIVFTPASLPLPDGQYSIGVFPRLRGAGGGPLEPAPVFHSFTVGSADTTAPSIVITRPVAGARDVGAGVVPGGAHPSPAVSGVEVEGGSPDIVIRFTEPIAARSVTPRTVRVVDTGDSVPGGSERPAIPPAPGYPRLRPSGPSGSGGFEVVWRADPSSGGFPFGTRVRVTVVGSDGGANAASVTDAAGNALPTSYAFEFATVPPPSSPTGR